MVTFLHKTIYLHSIDEITLHDLEYKYFSKHDTAQCNNDMSNPQNLQAVLSWIMHWLGEGDRDLPKDAEASLKTADNAFSPNITEIYVDIQHYKCRM